MVDTATEPTAAPPSTDTGTPSANPPQNSDTPAPSPDAQILTSPSTDTGAAPQDADTNAAANVPEIPESYALTLPEGSTLPTQFVDDVAAYAKDNGLTQDQAQAQITREATAEQNFVSHYTKEAADIAATWLSELKADPDIGGDAFDTNVALVKSVVEKFGGEDVMKVFNETGMGNNPAIVKMFVKIGALGADDTHVDGSGVAPTNKSRADVMYPNG